MDKEFYNLAVKLMDNIRQLEPNLVSARDAELCVLMTDSQQIYAGITSVKISAGQLMRACPEYNAIMAMVPENESRVLKLITVSFAHHEVSQPCEGCLELLCRVNRENVNTEIYVASNRCVSASELMPELLENATDVFVPAQESIEGEPTVPAAAAVIETAAEEAAPAEAPAAEAAPAEAPAEEAAPAEAAAENADFVVEKEDAEKAEDDKPKDEFAQFGFEEAEGDFADHVEIDKDNPFAAESSSAVEAPKVMTPPPTMFDKPQSGYLDSPEQSGYQQQGEVGSNMYASQPLPGQQQPSGQVFQPQNMPFQPGMQQQPMFQQQGGFPQQQMYQQQGGFPQQQMYQQQGGFPQQQMYQQQDGGFPQQQAFGQQPSQQMPQSQQFQPNPQMPQSQQFQPNPQMPQSQQFQPNPQFQQSQPASHYSHNSSQYQQNSQYQSTVSQYASQPLPGNNASSGSMTASRPLPGSDLSVQAPVQKEAGSAFKERLNAYVEEEEKPVSTKDKPLSKAELERQAREKKKMAKIDADFKKKMKKNGL